MVAENEKPSCYFFLAALLTQLVHFIPGCALRIFFALAIIFFIRALSWVLLCFAIVLNLKDLKTCFFVFEDIPGNHDQKSSDENNRTYIQNAVRGHADISIKIQIRDVSI
jgi:hypothetical protein